MLYVFHVDSGRMMSFDMNLALETVQFLKETIERQFAIPAFSQVLLVSGGETLEPKSRVCSYTAGTDTNPIYMFSTISDSRNQPGPWPSIDNDTDLKAEVEACLELPPTYNTVVRRAQLAQQICEMGREELKTCEKLVHEQHLQHQGWTSVIANMEDITSEFEKRAENYIKRFEEHMERRVEYKDYLENFDVDLEKLSKIPILSPLLKGAEDKPFNAFDDIYAMDKAAEGTDPPLSDKSSEKETTTDESSEAEQSKSGGASAGEKINDPNALTLLQWISSSENHKSLKRMAQSCTRELEIFDKKVMDSLSADIGNTIEHARREDMKEIKGLEERLRGLENLMCDARKIVQEQIDLAQAFQLNQNRAANLGDPSILPDLCNSHRSQLLVMLKNNKKLREITTRCAKAKDELGRNLSQRLKFVIHIENKMYEIDNTLLFYHRCLRRLQTHLTIIEQIHQAPCIYVQAVTEVVRRKIFSSAYLMWASDLACHLLTIYNEEVLRRQDFKNDFDGHFLTTLFPGIDDIPPKFATDAPSVFDCGLPNLSKDDLSELDNFLPELTKKIQLPNLDAVVEFFSFRSFKSSSDKSIEASDKSCEKCHPSNKKILSLRSQHRELMEKELESETDTEEYEKVTSTSHQLPDWRNVSVDATKILCDNCTSTEVDTKDSETLTEENLNTSQAEIAKLKQLIQLMQKTYKDALSTLKEQLSGIKTQTNIEKGELLQLIEVLSKSFEKLREETKNNERELVQRLTVDHELEMNDLRKSLYVKNDELASALNDKKELEDRYNEIAMRTSSERDLLQRNIDTLKDRVQLLETQLKDANNSKAMAVKEIKEKLQHEHKNEMESLRCKFKLMTNMERSPSDTSLEKIERPDILEISEHEAILSQLKQNFELEKEKAVKEAVELERQKINQQNLEASLRSKEPESPRLSTSNQDVMRRLVEEKERQLDKMREYSNNLQRENNRLKDTIQSLTDSDINPSSLGNLRERIEILEREKLKIEKDLEKEKSKRSKLLASSQNATGVTINSCSKNDSVLVAYNSFHNQYIIVQDSPLLYFLHADSYSGLNLMTIQHNQIPKTCYCIGKVIDKEYCHAKKDENRYRVGKGTKFYRVKVRPLSPFGDMDKSTIDRKRKRDSRQSITESTVAIETSTISESTLLDRSSQVISSQLIDSFAQTDMNLNLGASSSSSSHDMVDSGVISQVNKTSSIYKERNISVTEEDEPEPISLSDERFRYKSVSEEEDNEENVVALPESMDTEKKKDDGEASTLLTTTDTTAVDDSDEFRSLEAKDEDTEL